MSQNLQNVEIMRDELRGRVIEVAKKSFFSKGAKCVTMDDIAHQLTMSKRTLYQIFADKETLLLACLEESTRQHVLLLEEKRKETDNVLEIILFDFETRLQLLKQINPLFFTEVNRFPRIVEQMKEERLHHMEKAVLFMQNGVTQGLFRDDVDFRIVFTLLMSHIDSVDKVDGLREFSPIEIFKHLVFYYLRGCTTPKGMAMMDKFLEKNKL